MAAEVHPLPKMPEIKSLTHRLLGFAMALIVGVALSFAPSPALADQATERETVDSAWGHIKRNFYDQTFNGQDWEAARKRYLSRVEKGEAASGLVNEMVNSLGDRFSRSIDASTFEQLMAYDPLGVGLVLTRNEDRDVYVSSPPFAGSSAAKAGIKQGDYVTEVDGYSLKSQALLGVMDRVAQTDAPEVKLSLRRSAGSDQSERVWDAVLSRPRRAAPQNEVASGVVTANRASGGKIGYMRLRNFGARSALDVRDALIKLRSQGAEEFVIDLRGNPGGSFQAALEIAEIFLEPGSVATKVQKGGSSFQDLRIGEASPSTGSTSLAVAREPVAVLVDGGSASASEVLAVALRGNCRAPLLGAKTYGKAKVQGVFGLPNKEAIAITVARYSGPRGENLDAGLQPDAPGPGGSLPSGFLPGGGSTFAAAANLLGLPADLQAGEYASVDVAAVGKTIQGSCTQP
eukprot:TRINITY_DN3001_c0_g2_i1.p1 TRINITY_DN3001_c0_g2~~TRINITY_DN3001_c0_g2_i1.p1  ORF type:complete len:531 (-),score=114.20 TRINITY_DN3001_c0_g2_i1:149-1528(-)